MLHAKPAFAETPVSDLLRTQTPRASALMPLGWMTVAELDEESARADPRAGEQP